MDLVLAAAGLSENDGITWRAFSMSRASSGAWVREARPIGMERERHAKRIEDTAG